MAIEPVAPVALVLRRPCVRCSGNSGRIETRNGQDTVWCTGCNTFQYNAPKTETGRAPRTVQTLHNISPSKRARILQQAAGRCEACGRTGAGVNLHIAHFISIADGLLHGFTELELNDDENLYAACDECNLGQGRITVPLRFRVAIHRIRLTRRSPIED